jgi:flagellar export protein FliJ
MKKFQFPLQRVLEYRKLQLECEQARLEECLARLQAVDAMEKELERQRSEAEHDIRVRRASEYAVPAAEGVAFSGYAGHVTRVGQMLAMRRSENTRHVEQQRAVVLDARQRVEMLDHARQRARQRWLKDSDREQEQLASDLHLARWR